MKLIITLLSSRGNLVIPFSISLIELILHQLIVRTKSSFFVTIVNRFSEVPYLTEFSNLFPFISPLKDPEIKRGA
jgi:hypothetical protein